PHPVVTTLFRPRQPNVRGQRPGRARRSPVRWRAKFGATAAGIQAPFSSVLTPLKSREPHAGVGGAPLPSVFGSPAAFDGRPPRLLNSLLLRVMRDATL